MELQKTIAAFISYLPCICLAASFDYPVDIARMFSEISVSGNVCIVKAASSEVSKKPISLLYNGETRQLEPGAEVSLLEGGVFKFTKEVSDYAIIRVEVMNGGMLSSSYPVDDPFFSLTNTIVHVNVQMASPYRLLKDDSRDSFSFCINGDRQLYDYNHKCLIQPEWPIAFRATSTEQFVREAIVKLAEDDLLFAKKELELFNKSKVRDLSSQLLENGATDVVAYGVSKEDQQRLGALPLKRYVVFSKVDDSPETSLVGFLSSFGTLRILRCNCDNVPLVVMRKRGKEQWQCSFYNAEFMPVCALFYDRNLAKTQFVPLEGSMSGGLTEEQSKFTATRILTLAERVHARLQLDD